MEYYKRASRGVPSGKGTSVFIIILQVVPQIFSPISETKLTWSPTAQTVYLCGMKHRYLSNSFKAPVTEIALDDRYCMQTGRSSYWSMLVVPPSNVSIITSSVTWCIPQWTGACGSVASNTHELTRRFKNSVLKRREGMLLLFMVISSYPLPPSSTSILQPR
jgi:hypothetical protein